MTVYDIEHRKVPWHPSAPSVSFATSKGPTASIIVTFSALVGLSRPGESEMSPRQETKERERGPPPFSLILGPPFQVWKRSETGIYLRVRGAACCVLFQQYAPMRPSQQYAPFKRQSLPHA